MRNLKQRFLFVELFVGLLSVIFGTVLSVMVFESGYFPGAFMLIITGFLTLVLSFKEFRNPTAQNEKYKTLNLLYTILRRSFFFLNLMLSTLVIYTILNLFDL